MRVCYPMGRDEAMSDEPVTFVVDKGHRRERRAARRSLVVEAAAALLG
jgi:hypothetical protein